MLDDELALVATWAGATVVTLKERYAFVDWGSDSLHLHDLHLPGRPHPGLTLAKGSLSARFIERRAYAAYLPARYLKHFRDCDEMHTVADAPSCAYPAWSVWRDDLDEDIANVARSTLLEVIVMAEEDTADVLELL
ncbi:MAG: hypothetical protein ACOH2H_22235 [Cypionkella sp.]